MPEAAPDGPVLSVPGPSAAPPHDEIHVWQADLEGLAEVPAAVEELLTEEERGRMRRFRFSADQLRFATGRAILRQVLGRYTGTPPGQIQFGFGEHGKPGIVYPEQCRVCFNVSHSGNLVMAGFAAGLEIGVDVEQVSRDCNINEIAPACFSPEERRAIFASPGTERESFFHYWVCKEAWIKADGRGLSLSLTDFEVIRSAAGKWIIRESAGQQPLPWNVQPLPCRPGYRCAVAARGAQWNVRMFTAEWL
jgi:4'-phosphopantetheinyl transferase